MIRLSDKKLAFLSVLSDFDVHELDDLAEACNTSRAGVYSLAGGLGDYVHAIARGWELLDPPDKSTSSGWLGYCLSPKGEDLIRLLLLQ